MLHVTLDPFTAIFRRLLEVFLNRGMVKVGTGWSGGSGAQPDGRCLPLLIFPCTIKSRNFLLAPAHPGGPGKKGRLMVVAMVLEVLKSAFVTWTLMVIKCLSFVHYFRQDV